MKRQEYNEIYGYLPTEIINKFSETDKKMCFIHYMMRKPTPAGWFIARTVVESLGEKFINYMLSQIVKSFEMDNVKVTKDLLIENMATQMEAFATDSNYLQEYIETYREEVLGIKDNDFDTDMSRKDTKTKDLKRDSKGRFTKKN